MARVTVEDCVLKVPNRFELVLLAAHRAREITSGAPLSIDRDDDKNPVVALREIADETVGLPHLREAVVRGLQKQVEIDESEETHEIEVDPSVFGISLPSADRIDGEAGAEASGFDEVDLDEEADEVDADEAVEAADEDALDDGLSADEDTLDDALAADEGVLDDGLAADIPAADGEDDADFAAGRAGALPDERDEEV